MGTGPAVLVTGAAGYVGRLCITGRAQAPDSRPGGQDQLPAVAHRAGPLERLMTRSLQSELDEA